MEQKAGSRRALRALFDRLHRQMNRRSAPAATRKGGRTMRPYQEEYIANVKQFIALSLLPTAEDVTPDGYAARIDGIRAQRRGLVQRNMELLRGSLLPELDLISGADGGQLQSLQKFSNHLLASPKQVDVGLASQIQQALLNVARQRCDRDGIIEHSYWLGIARFNLNSKQVNMERETAAFHQRARACFEEAASYLRDFDRAGNPDTQSYIIRSMANRSLGWLPTVGERTRLLSESLQVMEDPRYRAMAPQLPWDQFILAANRLMVSSIPHSRDKTMSSQDVADIMKAVYTVYHGTPPTPREAFHRAAIDFYCGVHGLDHMLKQMERQMDAASVRDFSQEGMYALISLPAFYCQYLREYPERVGEREKFYLAGLYRRVLIYLDNFPEGQEDENLFFYLRQLTCTFVETPQGISYRDFMTRLYLRFLPEIYADGRVTAELAQVLCAAILDRDGSFFDSIDAIRAITSPTEKRRAVLDFAEGCALFHDVGQINCLELHTRTTRQWFPEEAELARLHTIAGHRLLEARASTRPFAACALGHHAWYDGSTRLGYPAGYHRAEHPERRMVDVVALADWLSDVTGPYQPNTERQRPLNEAADAARTMGGRRFSPHLTTLLEDREVLDGLQRALDAGRQRACRELYGAGKRTAG